MTYGRLLTLVGESLRRRTLDRKSWFRLLLAEPRPGRVSPARARGTRIRPVAPS